MTLVSRRFFTFYLSIVGKKKSRLNVLNFHVACMYMSVRIQGFILELTTWVDHMGPLVTRDRTPLFQEGGPKQCDIFCQLV